MKKSTYQNKLADLLATFNPELNKFKTEPEGKSSKKKKQNGYNAPVPVTEDEISNFRQAQGVIYFLSAPELFQPRVCGHCGESFLVSRMYVKFCSYTCIRKSLEEMGLQWEKGHDIEALVNDVYDGNEPIWIKNLDKIRKVLDEVSSVHVCNEG